VHAAGLVQSLDDFYQLDSKLVMLQTTNEIFDAELYDQVSPHSLLAWQRVRVANMMSDSGREWYSKVRKYNSGNNTGALFVTCIRPIYCASKSHSLTARQRKHSL